MDIALDANLGNQIITLILNRNRIFFSTIWSWYL